MTAAFLNLKFKNKTTLDNKDVYITFQNPSLGTNNFQVTYNGGQPVQFANEANLMSESLSLKEIGEEGFAITELLGGILYVSYGAPLTSTTSAPSYIGSSGQDYNTFFQPFELTRTGNPNDQGDLTAINYFTAPISIQSYSGSETGTPLQNVGFTQTAGEIGSEISALTQNNPASVITNKDGDIVRYIGPSSYGTDGTNPFPSFVPYLKAVSSDSQTTAIQNSNAFNAPPQAGPGSTNYNFILNLTATASTDGSITMTGSIDTQVTPYGGSTVDGPSFTDCTVQIGAEASQAYNNAIYGQVITDAVSFGSGWTDLSAYMDDKGLSDQNALNITQNLAIGEITSGLLMGFVNSSVVPAGKTVALKDMPSNAWWSLDPVIAFSDVQPLHAYYNTYANVIYKASNNEAYSLPYSDRLGDGPLVNSVQWDNQDVDTWVVTLEPPVPTAD